MLSPSINCRFSRSRTSASQLLKRRAAGSSSQVRTWAECASRRSFGLSSIRFGVGGCIRDSFLERVRHKSLYLIVTKVTKYLLHQKIRRKHHLYEVLLHRRWGHDRLHRAKKLRDCLVMTHHHLNKHHVVLLLDLFVYARCRGITR